MPTTETLTLHTPTGTPVEVQIVERHLGDGVRLRIAVPSKGLTGMATISAVRALTPAERRQIATMAPTVTHALELDGATSHGQPAKGAWVGVVADEAARLDAAIRAYVEADPRYQMEQQRRERERLLSAVRDAGDEIDAAKERAYDLDTGAGWGRVRAAEARWDEARAAVDRFDAAHPELVAELEQERETSIARHMWD